MISLMKKKLKDNDIAVKISDGLRRVYYKNLISDEQLIRKRFMKRLGREVNLENPTKFNDKLQWLKLNWYDPIATKCADKYEVREIVKERIGEEYLNELIAVYESVDKIDISKLPNQFVLKGTHGSGFNIICKNKFNMNWEEEFKKMRRWLGTNYYLQSREWVYKDQKPRIICEKYLSGEDGNPPNDYKVFCFNGQPRIIEVDFDRFKNHRRNFYDVNWNFIDGEIKYPNDATVDIKRPEKLTEMLNLSRALSTDFPHVRVDFYYLNNQIVFGELTFFHQSGMGEISPEEFEVAMGDWLELPE